MEQTGTQVEAVSTKKRGRKAKAADASTVATTKVLLTIARKQPDETLDLGTEQVAVPTAKAHGANKRALAVALYEVACELLRVESKPHSDLGGKLAALAFVYAGAAFCHGSKDALKGEVRENRGCSGYVKPEAAWWAKLTSETHSKVEALLPFARSIFAFYAKSGELTGETVEARFAALEGNLKR